MRREIGDEVHAEYQNQNQNSCGFDGAMDDIMGTFSDLEIWLGGDDQQDETPVADSSIFDNNFPQLPDFPCMSTNQFVSSSASPASSSSSAASWAMTKSNAQQKMKQDVRSIRYDMATPVPDLSYTDGFRPSDNTGMENVDCMNVMNNLGYMDLIEDGNDVWDPSCIFQGDDDQTNPDQRILNQEVPNEEDESCYIVEGVKEVVEGKLGLDELGVMFFEWLKNNKEHISAEDMRNIKFKKSTIECASKRLGSTQEGKKQLLRLILQWVEKYQLQNKRNRDAATAAAAAVAASHQVPNCQFQESFPNPNPNINNSITNTDANNLMWIPTPQTYFDQAMVAPSAAFPPPAMAYVGRDRHHPFVGGANASPMNFHAYSPQMPPTEYQMLEPAQSWPRSQFVVPPQYNSYPDQNGNFAPTPQPFAPVYGDQHPSQNYNGNNIGEGSVRLGASATKEARKKRMDRQRRGSLYHTHQNQLNKVDLPESEGLLSVENCTNNIKGPTDNWPCWPPATGAPILEQPSMEAQPQNQKRQMSHQQQAQSERGQQSQKQEFKGENNLKLLLQKVLKQSDVGNLGRIVLPKKEAETHLPQLDERDGISIAMEDIGNSKVWNLRYSLRFWPNNKSRMYLLENTGDFVKTNGLQEGDFIVIYSDIKSDKYLIRGVKVREQPARPRSEARVKATRKNHRNSGAGNEHSSTPSKLKA
ncbi:B3 domain-containing transcription factor ABI3 [Heracleum sosnowskyi]|uniref:B3 domain-containing transcription factor ABI3 n=1 Tax=Heracleum sosnowskyi TaxID=360622 RepID=A0AAD8GRW7_9APIA|nr:B3 domain-containing transcription factor ABI3 [Heracleum sosnowskyi]